MSKTSELDICIGELRNAAQSLTAVADSLTALFSGGNTEAPIPAAQPKPATEPKPITLEQVRAVLAEKSRIGHTADVRAWTSRFATVIIKSVCTKGKLQSHEK